MTTKEEFDAMTPEEQADMMIAIHNANKVHNAIIMGSVGMPVLDVINGCVLAVQSLTEAAKDPEIAEGVATSLRALADHLSGDCGCGQHGDGPATPPAAPSTPSRHMH